MAPFEPTIRKRLYAVQNLFLVFPKTLRIFSKRGRNRGSWQKHFLHGGPLCGSWQKHLLHGGPLFSEICILQRVSPSTLMLRTVVWRVAAVARSNVGAVAGSCSTVAL